MTEGWMQIISLFLANAALIVWFRAESRADWRHMDAKLDAFIKSTREEMKDFHNRIQDEMKDFHDRLIEIEIRRKSGKE